MLATNDFFSFSSFRQPSQQRTSFLAPIDPNTVSNMGVTPKSPRKANPPPLFFARSNSSSSSQASSSVQQQQQTVPFSKRPIKSFSSALRQKVSDRTGRVSRFLNDVRKKGEEKRWAARGGDDEIMRLIVQSEQEQWERYNQQQLAQMESFEEADLAAQITPDELAILEEFERQEEQELEALVANYEQPSIDQTQDNPHTNQIEPRESLYDIDDEEFDAIFDEMDFDTGNQQPEDPSGKSRTFDMDMSMD